jgi:hypothetical protein
MVDFLVNKDQNVPCTSHTFDTDWTVIIAL